MGKKRNSGRSYVWAVMLQTKEPFDRWGSESVDEEPYDVYPPELKYVAVKVVEDLNKTMPPNHRAIFRKELEGVYV